MKKLLILLFALLLISFKGIYAQNFEKVKIKPAGETAAKVDTVTFASGCFWCIEAKFSQLKGVQKVTSGYTGGYVKNPTYEQVSSGTTGHAEAANIIYDPSVISYDELLEAFFLSHDPTQLNRQGNDVGTQYRSAIFYHNAYQRERAEYYIDQLTEQHIYSNAIVTEVKPFTTFYDAERYHQEYYKKNPYREYCRYVIQPELEKFKKIFKNKLK
ncbi:peptide-methionine (S)-S-oxide reductase MsrA [Chryseobacterium sp.]|jgi:peptide-methionine (S)-S-oxide reductase|uniref:peptide-methionine (S)-S-oxide reductase MsrA n=1 Tax=Chryseobacterium sp. TaxID=1871047 RepID=UPI00283FF885|nr:peptide-methionine (S)-S-oxide reductase MsrA [Chryseobacterium sp.]MDR3025031.1 peptide-methionine (S)-S-oxide reductase MsrA [Chryseobacterium sp.]